MATVTNWFEMRIPIGNYMRKIANNNKSVFLVSEIQKLNFDRIVVETKNVVVLNSSISMM